MIGNFKTKEFCILKYELKYFFVETCKRYTYQSERGTVTQVQGNRTKRFGILTNSVDSNRLIGKSALRYTMPQITLLKENWTKRSMALVSTQLSKSSSDC